MAFIFNKNIIYSVLTTEKSCKLRDDLKKVSFSVSLKATKEQIKFEVEKVFSVPVLSIRTLITKCEGRMFRGRRGSSRFEKKAYVSMSSDSGFDFSKLQ